MKHMALFITIVLLVFSLANIYVISRGWQMLEGIGKYRWVYLISFVCLAALFLGGILLKHSYDNPIVELVWRIGSWWLVIILYSFLAALCFDLVRLVLLCFGQKLSMLFANYAQLKLALFSLFSLFLLVILVIGYRNGNSPKVTNLDLTIHKNAGGRKALNIVAISDLHLGDVYSKSDLQKWVQQVNALQPDIVFLVGDIFDDNPAPVIRKNLGAIFEQFQAPLGTYAVSGNHEMIGNVVVAMNYLSQHKIQTLMDTAVLVDSSFYVVGRIDRAVNTQEKHRKTIEELTATLDKNFPIIVLDHQPYEWNESAQAGVDLQLAGHTHAGQLWPFSLVTRKMYEQHWGYLQKAQTQFYTSCGIGTWGPPVRIGSRSEIVQLHLTFD